MYLKLGPESDRLAKILTEENFGKQLIEGKSVANLFDEIEKVPGIEILERFNPKAKRQYDCADYVFIQRLKAGWYMRNRQVVRQKLWVDPDSVLLPRGYNRVEAFSDGDVIAYRAYNESRLTPTFGHWGIMHNGRVMSRYLNFGPICRNDINIIPRYWGDVAYFYRPPAEPK